MKMYKGYRIEKLTRVDWIVYDAEGNRVIPGEWQWSFKTVKAAKAYIDEIVK